MKTCFWAAHACMHACVCVHVCWMFEVGSVCKNSFPAALCPCSLGRSCTLLACSTSANGFPCAPLAGFALTPDPRLRVMATPLAPVCCCADACRLNVALTRAKHNLIIVGCAPALQQSAPAFAALLKQCRNTPSGFHPGGRLPPAIGGTVAAAARPAIALEAAECHVSSAASTAAGPAAGPEASHACGSEATAREERRDSWTAAEGG
jgi:hypothetical protein